MLIPSCADAIPYASANVIEEHTSGWATYNHQPPDGLNVSRALRDNSGVHDPQKMTLNAAPIVEAEGITAAFLIP